MHKITPWSWVTPLPLARGEATVLGKYSISALVVRFGIAETLGENRREPVFFQD